MILPIKEHMAFNRSMALVSFQSWQDGNNSSFHSLG